MLTFFGQELSTKTGYWVYSKNRFNFDMIGVLESNPIRKLTFGWNLFGPLDRIAKPNGNAVSGTIWYWNEKETKFQSVNSGDDLLPRRSYWIYATNAVNINCSTGEVLD